MNILLINNFFVVFMVSEIPRVSVFGHYPYSVTFPYSKTDSTVVCMNRYSVSFQYRKHFPYMYRIKCFLEVYECKDCF